LCKNLEKIFAGRKKNWAEVEEGRFAYGEAKRNN
jgi:hypothetical protein